jgi:ABC-type glycerol-3-phosphate transport system substrate-binding protein
MISAAELVYTDINADGKTPDDVFGISAFMNVPVAPIIQACDISLVEMDEKGNYKVSVYNEKNKQKMSDLVDKLNAFANSDCAFIKKDSSNPSKIFTEGRGLMHLATTFSLPGMLQYDVDFGVLPYPMYDENQKDVGYRSLNWGGYLCVPSYLSNPTMVYETIEMLAYFSDDVNTAFYEKLLGKQVADSPQDRDMLVMVWDSICSDFGQTYGSAMHSKVDFLFMLCNLIGDGAQSLASYVASGESSANKNLKGFVNKVK